MRGLREHPRLAVARALGAICLILIGVAISAVDGRGEGDRIRAMEARLATANQSSTAWGAELRMAVARSRRAEVLLARAERRIAALTRTNRRLRHELRSATRARPDRKRRR